jgi:nicotinamidase-related amidase
MKTALLVIDVQQSFQHRPYWREDDVPAFRARLLELVAGCRARGVPVLHVLHEDPGSNGPFDPARDLVRELEWLPPAPDAVFRKRTYSALASGGLRDWLVERGVRRLVVSGIRTEQCCETTTRLASDLGYQVTFVVDATATNPIAHPDAPADLTPEQILADPRTLSAAAVVERTVFALAKRFATIATVDEVVGASEVLIDGMAAAPVG